MNAIAVADLRVCPRGARFLVGRDGRSIIPRDLLPLVRKALVGRFDVEREVARGGAARVFLASDKTGAVVALKVMHPELAVTVTADRFLREIEYLRKMSHPNISKLIDYGEADWLIYYVMGYVEGPNLRTYLKRVGRCSTEETRDLALDLFSALEYAHGSGVVHRDVKPDNIVLASEGAVLMDFGIARAVAQSAEDRLTRSGFAVGTSTYMSPEQISGEGVIDHRSDIYSLGCVLFECLTGRPPFEARKDEAVFAMHRKEPAVDVRTVRDDTPESMAVAVNRCLEKRPDDRWQSVEAMRRQLTGD